MHEGWKKGIFSPVVLSHLPFLRVTLCIFVAKNKKEKNPSCTSAAKIRIPV